MGKKFLSESKLPKFLAKCSEIFARKEVEDKVIDIELSKEAPTDQKIGDYWFAITERE